MWFVYGIFPTNCVFIVFNIIMCNTSIHTADKSLSVVVFFPKLSYIQIVYLLLARKLIHPVPVRLLMSKLYTRT